MILTRRLIFIISIVLFFVNRATSGNISFSDTRFEDLLDGSSSLSTDEEKEEVNSLVNSEQLRYCKLELTTPFQKAKPFDNFLHAFLYINTADFKVRKLYTDAAYEYFYDLLSTAQDLNQPASENPRQYCLNHHRNQAESCLRGIAEIGCQPDDVGVICVKKLYLDWKKDDSIVYSTPYYGLDNVSDEELANAICRGANRFSNLSDGELLSRLSDENLLKVFYRENKDRRKQINKLHRNLNKAISAVRRLSSNIVVEAYYSILHLVKHMPKNITIRNNIPIEYQNYEYHNTQFTIQRAADMRDARHYCYGYNGLPYRTLFYEYNRRQNVYKQLGDSYAMYLYNQIQLFGRNMELESEERKIFNDPENFCTKFLLNNPHYYDYLN